MKKYIYFDLFHLSLVLSLLRFHPNAYRGISWFEERYDQDVYLGDSAAYTQARFHNLNNQVNGFVHPKNIDNVIERTLFIRDVNSIYRRPLYNSQQRETNVFAYILNELRPPTGSNTDTTEETPAPEQTDSQSQIPNVEPTQADLDLIDILWKQDVDMEVSGEMYDDTWSSKESTEKLLEQDSATPENLTLPGTDSRDGAAIVPNHHADVPIDQPFSLFESESGHDMRTDIMFTNNLVDDYTSNELIREDLLFNPQNAYAGNINTNRSLMEQLHDLQQMVSEAHVDPYPEDFGPMHSDYSDLSPNYNTTENNSAVLDALLQNTSLMLPFSESLLSSDELALEHDININSLLSFLSNDSDPNPAGAVGGQDHSDVRPDMSTANLTVDNTFLSQLMSEGSMDFSDYSNLSINTNLQNTWSTDTSSNDSAVSGMGSNWSDSCSGESGNGELNTQDYASTGLDGPTLIKKESDFQKTTPNSAQKFNLFGKQGCHNIQSTTLKSKLDSNPVHTDQEYLEHSRIESFHRLPRLALMHNHTYYHSDNSDEKPSKVLLEKNKPPSGSQVHVSTRGTRDDKRLLSAKLPLTAKEVVELPIEKFNERIAELCLSDAELSLIRDIRRRGKNKVAAQICRKRKVDQISDLEIVIDDLLNKRYLAYANMAKAIAQRDLLKQKYQQLHRFIFPGCDPPDPVPASYFRDGSVVPPTSFSLNSNSTSGNDNEQKKRGKHK